VIADRTLSDRTLRRADRPHHRLTRPGSVRAGRGHQRWPTLSWCAWR